jgi:L-ribulokinase
MPVRILASRQGGALGSAILGAVAAGKAQGGYDTPEAAMKAMASRWETSYLPDPANSAVYDKLYGIYRSLHDSNVRDLMHTLSCLRRDADM